MDRIVSPQQTDNYLFEEIDNILFIEPIPLLHTSFTMDGIVSLPGTDDYLYEGIENILSAVKTDTDYIEPLDFDEEPEVDSRGDSSNSSEHTRQQTNPTIQCTTMITRLDVVAGRGQGIQRLPGNKRYRKLVSMNKKIYARCNSNDKCKVSRGIVAAIRQSGGRFLEYNEHSRSYHDIDDRKTWAKTSQALREGLKKIRTTIYFDEAAGHPQSGLDTHLLGSHRGECVAAERYIEISVRFLQSIDETDETS